MTETWTIHEVAAYLGYTSPSATGNARKQLSRWGIEALGRQPGRSGISYYNAELVKTAHAQRPGRGHRTDLPKETP
jgi:hypothetical protein